MDDIEKYITMGSECFDRKDMNGAMVNANKALSISELDEEFAVAYFLRANVYAQIDKTEQAIEDFKKAADYGNEEALIVLKTAGLKYTPKTPTAIPKQTTNSGGFASSAMPKPAAQPAASNTNIFCSNCGNKLNGNNFCPKCGTPASQTAQVQTTAPSSLVTRGKKKVFGNDYEGDLVNDEPHGKGKLTSPDGSSYEGDFADGIPHGKGKKTFANRNVYEGDFWEGKQQGKGKFTWTNGDIYQGDWFNDKIHGKGKFTWGDGVVYEGDWVNGNRTGKGKQTFTNRDFYEGDFVDGNWTGKGKYVYASGKVEEGNWKNNDFLG
jgi:hypothetical protein